MKRKRITIVVGIVLLLVLTAAVVLIGILHKVLYPDALVTGNGACKVICVGDSITYGQGVLTERKTKSYTALLSGCLGSKYQVVNYGLCNRTLLSDGDMPYGEEDFAAESLQSDANIVILMLGTNDSKAANWDAKKYREEYVQFVQAYLDMESQPKVYVMIPPKVFLDGEDNGNCNDTIIREEIAPIITEVAAETGAELIDLYTLTEKHPEWFADGLHPNAEGNREIAKCICSVLQED